GLGGPGQRSRYKAVKCYEPRKTYARSSGEDESTPPSAGSKQFLGSMRLEVTAIKDCFALPKGDAARGGPDIVKDGWRPAFHFGHSLTGMSERSFQAVTLIALFPHAN